MTAFLATCCGIANHVSPWSVLLIQSSRNIYLNRRVHLKERLWKIFFLLVQKRKLFSIGKISLCFTSVLLLEISLTKQDISRSVVNELEKATTLCKFSYRKQFCKFRVVSFPRLNTIWISVVILCDPLSENTRHEHELVGFSQKYCSIYSLV